MLLIWVDEIDTAPEKDQMVVPSDVTPVRTWKYGVISPYAKPTNPAAGQSWDWVTYLNKVTIMMTLNWKNRIDFF